jgi:IS30 family transposase
MARGKLSVTEKYAIQGMLHDGQSVTDIAKSLERTEATIRGYVESELSTLQETIVRAQVSASEEAPRIELSEEIYEGTIHKLRQAGMLREDAIEVLERTIKKLKFEPENAQQVYTLCIRNLNAKDVMNTRTAGGNKGVSVMNRAASERGDESRKKAKSESRSARGNTFKPKDNRMG